MTAQTPIEVFLEATERGIKLEFEPPFSLRVDPQGKSCPHSFVDALSRHKAQLLALLALPFVIVDSKTVGEILFFCQDEQTKAALHEAGAEEWAIYTRDELRILCEQNRIAPLSQAELRKVHEIKKTFNARIRESS